VKIDRNSLIAGRSVKAVRDLLHEVARGDCFTAEAVVDYLLRERWREYVDELIASGRLRADSRTYWRRDWKRLMQEKVVYGGKIRIKKMPDQTVAAQALIDALLKNGMIGLCADYSRPEAYTTTMAGNAMRMTGFVPRVNRAKAEKLLADFLRRVAGVNARDDLLHWVTEVRVFGSYLTDSDDLGDLDLAIDLERRPVEKTGEYSWANACVEMARRSGKTFGTYMDELVYPERLVRQLIKNRSPYISLHDTKELDDNPAIGGKTVYTFAPTT
jgi:hypothetical protein